MRSRNATLIHELMPLYDLDTNFSLLFKMLLQHRGVELPDRAIFPFNQMSDGTYQKGESILDQVLREYQALK